MSYTESGRLAALQASVRRCTVNDVIRNMSKIPPVPYGNTSAQGVGDASSSHTEKIAQQFQPGGTCFVERKLYQAPCPPGTIISATQTIQTESQYTKSVQAAAIACGTGYGVPPISAGGTTESVRLRKLQDQINYCDYTVNPDARFLEYQRFTPTPCPPAPIANNMPDPKPRFPCALNQQVGNTY
jgi:hypothetical protein